MIKVYACLIGNWVNLGDDPECVMSSNMSSPFIWYKEGGDVWSPQKKRE